MSIEKARGALDVIRRQAQIAVDALIDAKLSPAPVGRHRPIAGVDGNYGFAHDPADQSREDARREGREAAERICAKVYGDPNRRAPTPPAKDTEGEASDFALSDVVFAEQADRIADLEARLAEAERRARKSGEHTELIEAQWTAAHERAIAAERALADATKRIEALEAAPMVKPLEWVKHPERDAWRVDTMLGTYKVFAIMSPVSWTFDGGFAAVGGKIDLLAASPEAAKAAAQADYETRIRSALLSPASEGKTHG